MSKKIIAIILAIAIIVGGAGFLIWNNQASSEDFRIDELLAPPVAADFYEEENKLKVNKGSVTVIREDGEEEVIEDETVVNMGDTIIVNPESMATIQWFDDSISRLQADTELTIDKADYNPENITETDINLNVIKGEVWSKVKNLVDEESEFLSYSGNVVAGVRGSTYNFIVSDEEVAVESIKHAAFVGRMNPDSKTIEKPIYITRGKRATVKGPAVIKVDKIPKERFQQEWFQDNKNKDWEAAKQLRKKDFERIKKRAGVLPGEKDYKKKMKLIQKQIKAIDDPAERAEMEARIAQMKVNEALALTIEKRGGRQDIARHLEKAKESLEKMPEELRQEVAQQIQTEIKAIDRAMESVLPDNKQLYEIKEVLRANQIELEIDPERQKKMHEKIAERRLYELTDAAEEGNMNPEQLKQALQRYQSDMENIKDAFENWEDFQGIALEMIEGLEEIKGFNIDPSELKEIKEFMGSEEFEKAMQEAQKVINNLPSQEELLRIQKEAQAELERIKKEAEALIPPPEPVITKPVITEPVKDPIRLLDIPAEDPDVVKEEAPYYKGESGM